jgi:hypothetical protein
MANTYLDKEIDGLIETFPIYHDDAASLIISGFNDIQTNAYT